jgi:hypothetical protein
MLAGFAEGIQSLFWSTLLAIESFAQTALEIINWLIQTTLQIVDEISHDLAQFSTAEWLVLFSVLLIVFGFRRRLYLSGLFMFFLGVTFLIFGLGSIVSPDRMPIQL